MIITISGDAGSGKNTVGKILSEKLNMPLYCVGDLRRKLASEKGMNLEELNKLGEKESFTDLEVDSFQQDLGAKEDNFIMIGRVSFHFIPNSKKIYLAVRPEVGAERVSKDKTRATESYKNLEEAKTKLEQRKQCDIRRYKKYYNIENAFDHDNYDSVIDTSDMMPEQVADKIIEFVKRK